MTLAVPDTAWRMPVAVDAVALTIFDDRLCALLVERGIEPYLGGLALPGGFVLEGESIEDALRREVAEETGLRPSRVEQLRSYGPLDRDPRGPVLSVAYLVILPEGGSPAPGGDAGAARWVPVDEIDKPAALAFDHRTILDDGVERLRAKLEYSPLAVAFCPDQTFTIADLHRIYETVWGVRLDLRNFHRKITGTTGFVEPTGETRTPPVGRPAALYRRAPGLNLWASVLHPPIMRPAKP